MKWRMILMTISEQIKVLCVRCGVSEAELARRLGKSPQSFNSKMKRGSFIILELEDVAEALGVQFNREFILSNGEKV
jgi:IS30 family transposase